MTDRTDSGASVAAIATADTTTQAELAKGSIRLETDIVINGKVAFPAGTVITLTKPKAGAFRGGINLMGLYQLDYGQMEMILPRVTMPILQKVHVANMDPADLMAAGGEVLDFLLPKAAKDSLAA